jgi:hypothetical protein
MDSEQIRKLYNSFEKKDMPFEEFKKEIKNLTDPKKMQEDLANIRLTRQIRKDIKNAGN